MSTRTFIAIVTICSFVAMVCSFSLCCTKGCFIGAMAFGLLSGFCFLRGCIRLIKGAVVTLFLVTLCSCQTGMYESLHEEYSGGVIAVRNRVRDIQGQFGGTRSVRRADGSSEVNDYQVTARDFFSAVGVGFSTWSYASQQAAKFAWQKFQAKQITEQQFNQQIFELRKFEAAGKGTPLSPGSTLVTPNGPVTAPVL